MPPRIEAPVPPADPPRMRRVATRRDPSPLIQIPVWGATDAPASSTEDGSGTDQLLGGLNPEQRRAVTHGEGPLLVVAGAGTGKTQVITRRIAWLIATKRAKPSEILALTFTDQAADEMQVRVDQLVPYGHNDAAIATFHAFGDRLIREFAFELGLPPDVRVLSRPETVVFLREHLFDFELDEYRPLGDPTRFLAALATLFSRAKDEDVSPAAYLAHAQQLVAEAERAAAALEAPAPMPPMATGMPPTRSPRRRGGNSSSLARSSATRRSWGRTAASTSATRSHWRSSSYASRPPCARRSSSGSGTSSSTSSRTRTGPRRSSSRCSRNGIGTSPSSATTTSRSTSSAARRSATSSSSASATGMRGSWSCAATIGRCRRSWTRRTGSSATTTRTGSRSAPAWSSGWCPSGSIPSRAPVRHEAFATGSEEADWIAAEIGRRIGDGARPATSRSSSAPTPTPTRCSVPSNVAGIPWRFSGTSGLYARPEVRLLLAFLRAIADLSS